MVERAYARTVGLWVRGILTHEYGVDIGKITWVSVEEEHVPEFRLVDRTRLRPTPSSAWARTCASSLVSGQVAGGVAPGAGFLAWRRSSPMRMREAAAGYYRRTCLWTWHGKSAR